MLTSPWIVAAVLVLSSAGLAQAQTRRPSMLPAELPPSDFDAAEFVDSRGCAFVRAALNGETTWLPLFDDDRQQVCGLTPTGVAGPPPPTRVIISPTPVAPPAEEPAAIASDPAPPETAPSEAATEAATETAPETAPVAEAPAQPPASPVIATPEPEAPRATLRVIAQRGTVIVVPPDPNAPQVLRVIAQRGTVFYPDA